MARSKNNIAENVFALAPETDSSDYYAATQEKMGRLDISSSKRVYYKTKDLYGIIWEVGRFGNTFGLWLYIFYIQTNEMPLNGFSKRYK